MQPKSQDKQGCLFKQKLSEFINMNHELVKLADKIDWQVFEKEFGRVYIAGKGRPALPTRLMVGLQFLKSTYNLSDEETVSMLMQNVYWQYFCGFVYFENKLPLDPSSMTRWRKRVKSQGMEKLLEQTVKTALEVKCIKPKDLEKVTTDTTVQETNIAFPTDITLMARACELLVRESKKLNIVFRQTYVRTIPHLLRKYWHSNRSKKYKESKKILRKVKTILGRLIREIRNKLQLKRMTERLKELLSQSERIYNQKRTDKNKIYSLFEPDTNCIGKGKAKQKYEFGHKVSITVTHRSNFVIGALALSGCPNDATTLKSSIEQVTRITKVKPKEIYCDKGYRGAEWHREISGKVLIPGVKQEITKRQKRDLKRRNAIEPIIGHMKFGHGMQRSFLKGEAGAAVNALMSACGFNIRKLLKYLKSFLHFFKNWKITSKMQILRFFRSYFQNFCKFAIVQ